MAEVDRGNSKIESTGKVSQAKFIFKDLSDSLAGRMNDALPSLNCLQKSSKKSVRSERVKTSWPLQMRTFQEHWATGFVCRNQQLLQTLVLSRIAEALNESGD